MVKLVLDPGHGGKDPGAVGNGLQEKDLTLKIARYCRDFILANYTGVEVHLTRDSDVYVDLSARAAFANKLKADYFQSIHINAGGGKGFESFIWNGSYSSKSRTQALRNVIHDQIVADTGFVNRGRKEANYAVIRETNMPANLTENGFIDNPSDANFLKSEANLKLIGEAHARGLAKALGFTAKPKPAPAPAKPAPAAPAATGGQTFYRVVTGSFTERSNAEKRIQELKKAGFDSFLDVYQK